MSARDECLFCVTSVHRPGWSMRMRPLCPFCSRKPAQSFPLHVLMVLFALTPLHMIHGTFTLKALAMSPFHCT